MSESSNEMTYVHDGIEVKKTGRTAKKERKGTSKRVAATATLLYEITPSDRESGSWKKWVREEELFEIVGDE